MDIFEFLASPVGGIVAVVFLGTIVILVYFFLSRKPIAEGRGRVRVEMGPSGIKLWADILGKHTPLLPQDRSKLLDLTSYDIWALYDFHTERIDRDISDLLPMQKVAAKNLEGAGLVELRDVNGRQRFRATPRGEQALRAAEEIRFDVKQQAG